MNFKNNKMKTNRVRCNECSNFIAPVFRNRDESDLFNAVVISRAKCKLGKRVMFRWAGNDENKIGYFRNCDKYHIIIK